MKTAIPRRKRPSPISAKRRIEAAEYRRRRIAFLKDHPFCEFFLRLRGSRIPSTQVHHTRGRSGRLYLATEFWAAVSDAGHRRITNEPALARELGLLGPWGKQD